MPKFRKKPVEVEAVEWNKAGDHPAVGHYSDDSTPCHYCHLPIYGHGWIDTLEGGHIVCPGDYVVTGVQGENYPVKPSIFRQTYAPLPRSPGRTGRLAGMRIYLSGPMDRVPDGGIVWRQEITPILQDYGLIVFDPVNKPIATCQDETDQSERRRWTREGRWDLVRQFVKEIRGQDLRMVNTCDFLILRVDPDVHMAGSYEEAAIANHEKKPILVWTVGGKERTPWWLFGMLPHEHIFGSREDLLAYLDHVDTAPRVRTFRRWFFFRQDVLYNRAVLGRLGG